MVISYSATTARRHNNTATTACIHMHLHIITIFALLLASNCNVCVETQLASKVESYEFREFADFLIQQHLKHAIVAYNSKTLPRYEQLELFNAMRTLQNITTLHFYDVHQAKISKNYTNFKNLFFYDTTRVGIYLTELEDGLLQKYVLGTYADTSALRFVQPDRHNLEDDIFLRFNNSQVWFIMSKEKSLANAIKVMTSLPLNISADVTLGVRVDKNNTIKLFDIYKIHPHLLEIEEKGYWSSTEGIQLKKQFLQSFISRRRDFKGLRLRGGTVIREKPENISDLDYLNSLAHKKLDTMQRKIYQLLIMLEPMFNVSFEVNIAKTWGKLWPNGSWDGVMAMLLSGDVEFAMCPMRFASSRVAMMHYTPGVHVEFISFIFRHPRRNDIRNIFLGPFVEEVWYAVVVVIILTTFLLLLQLRHEHHFSLIKDRHFQCRFDYAVLSIVEAFFMQGPDYNAFGAISTRTLIFFVCLFGLLLQQFYGAFIVGSLLADSPRTITNLEALYNSSLDIGMENIPYNVEFFENSISPFVHAIYKKRICHNRERHVLSIDDGAERIRKGGFAFHVSANRIYFVLKDILKEDEFCDLQQISFVPPFHSGIGVGKLSPFRDYITSSILKWQTTGLMQHNDNKWQLPRMDCSLTQNREVEVDMQHFLPAILLLCSLGLFCVAILILEIIYHKLENRFKRFLMIVV